MQNNANAARMTNEIEVYFTSPILGQIYGTITRQQDNYRFIGKNVLVSIELRRLATGWICEQEQWLHDSQVQEIGNQIDDAERVAPAR